jgi:hypothetical protein
MKHIKLFKESNESSEKSSSTMKKEVNKMLKKTAGKERDEFVDKIKEKGLENVNLEGFINDSDIYEFYLTYQSEIDSILNDADWFNKKPSSYAAFSLYDIIIKGTRFAVEKIITKK